MQSQFDNRYLVNHIIHGHFLNNGNSVPFPLSLSVLICGILTFLLIQRPLKIPSSLDFLPHRIMFHNRVSALKASPLFYQKKKIKLLSEKRVNQDIQLSSKPIGLCASNADHFQVSQ